MGHSIRTLLWDTLVGHSCRTLLGDTLAGHSCRKLQGDTLIGHSCGTLLRDTLVRHSCGDTLVGHSYGTLLFRGCHLLHSITVPGCLDFGYKAFADCCSLQWVHANGGGVNHLGSATKLGHYLFVDNAIVSFVPRICQNLYASA